MNQYFLNFDEDYNASQNMGSAAVLLDNSNHIIYAQVFYMAETSTHKAFEFIGLCLIICLLTTKILGM